MPLKERLGVCVLLCLGFIVTIAGIVRTFFIWKSLMHSWDEPWFAYPLWIAAAIEIDLAVVSTGVKDHLLKKADARDRSAPAHRLGSHCCINQSCACLKPYRQSCRLFAARTTPKVPAVAPRTADPRSSTHCEAYPGSRSHGWGSREVVRLQTGVKCATWSTALRTRLSWASKTIGLKCSLTLAREASGTPRLSKTRRLGPQHRR